MFEKDKLLVILHREDYEALYLYRRMQWSLSPTRGMSGRGVLVTYPPTY